MNSDTSAQPAHQAPCSNRDYDFFYLGLERGELLIQSCRSCGALRNPPLPSCPECRSLEWEPRAMSGVGSIFSYMVHHHPPMPGFQTPHPVAVIALDEGIRFVAAMDGTAPEALKIGLPVQAEFFRRDAVATVRFKLA